MPDIVSTAPPPSNRKNFTDLTGKTFGRLTVVQFVGRDKRSRGVWLCSCSCGKMTNVLTNHLNSGNTSSCGCAPRGPARHGKTSSKVHGTWCDIRKRCENPKTISYPNYGGRGVRVCKGWHTFENFYADMGDPPTPKHSIDRIETEGHYSCGHCPECLDNGWKANCRWSTFKEQCLNKRNNHLETFQGETLPVTFWAEQFGMNPQTLFDRLNKGWSFERALTQPMRKSPTKGNS